MQYGSNYTHTAPNPDTAHQPGVVYNFHTNRQQIQDQLGLMRQNGLSAIKIPLYYWAAEQNPAQLPYVPDGFTLGLYGNSFDDQRMQNCADLFEEIGKAGFEYLEVSFLPAGGVISPLDPVYAPEGWVRSALLISVIRPLARSPKVNVRDIWFDLIGEGIPNSQQGNLLSYSQNLWAWYTVSYGNVDATISFVPTREIIGNLDSVFRGPDQNGPVNWPKQLQPHVYGAMPEPGWGSAYSTLCETIDLLPVGFDIEVGETYSFEDLTTIAEIQRAAEDRPGRIVRVLQWPMLRPSTNDELASPPVRGVGDGGS